LLVRHVVTLLGVKTAYTSASDVQGVRGKIEEKLIAKLVHTCAMCCDTYYGQCGFAPRTCISTVITANLALKVSLCGCRLSLSWTRIVPGGFKGSTVNAEGVKFYKQLLQGLK
jgi:hypothetical protein